MPGDPIALYTRGRNVDPEQIAKLRAALNKPLGEQFLAYLANPIDLVPDFLPVAGQLDDAVLLGVALRVLVRGGGEQLAEEMSVAFLGRLPVYTPIRIGGDRGVPLVIAEPTSVAGTAIFRLAERVAMRCAVAAHENAIKFKGKISGPAHLGLCLQNANLFLDGKPIIDHGDFVPAELRRHG